MHKKSDTQEDPCENEEDAIIHQARQEELEDLMKGDF